jgi:hypothetical protein
VEEAKVVNQPELGLRDIIDILKEESSTCNVRWEKVKLYDISPLEFLSFAKQDLKEDSERGRINAIRNAKTAIECRADEILTLSNLKSFSSQYKWSLPYKLLVLRTLGIVAPDVLKEYVTSKRNRLEHEYVRLSPEETRHLTDITELFLSATDKYVEKGYISSAIITLRFKGNRQKISRTREKSIDYENEYKLEFDLRNGALTITGELYECDSEYTKTTLKVKRKTEGERYVSNVKIANCKHTDVRDLMRLLWGKAL